MASKKAANKQKTSNGKSPPLCKNRDTPHGFSPRPKNGEKQIRRKNSEGRCARHIGQDAAGRAKFFAWQGRQSTCPQQVVRSRRLRLGSRLKRAESFFGVRWVPHKKKEDQPQIQGFLGSLDNRAGEKCQLQVCPRINCLLPSHLEPDKGAPLRRSGL